jgi:hypothetical protein
MPCAVTQEEIDYYNKQSNLKEYGVSELSGRITTTVACELSRVIETHGLSGELSELSLKWIENHKRQDSSR